MLHDLSQKPSRIKCRWQWVWRLQYGRSMVLVGCAQISAPGQDFGMKTDAPEGRVPGALC